PAVDAKPVGHELVFSGAVVNQERVGIAAAPMASACPVPTATTWTVMPVAAVKIGRMWPNNPESWVDVVELSVMNRSSACAEPAARTATSKATKRIMLTTSRPAHPGDGSSKQSQQINRGL